jgi:hypothetical protein
MEVDETRHTGLWPFNMLPSSAHGRSSDPSVQKAQVFDPVALAFSASSKFTDAGWIGLDLMPSSFLYKVMDAEKAGEDVASLISAWIEDKKQNIADEYQRRLQTYSFDELARRALHEALLSYRAGSYLSVVRTLMPEFERFGRMVALADGSRPRTQKQAVGAIQDYISMLPAGFYPTIESLAAFSLISEDLFASCFTEADALALSNPNRHAEMHGLTSYGDLRGATKVLSAADFLVSAVNAAMAMNANQKNASSS